MKIVLTAGGSGGHFYPLIAVAEELNKIAQEKKLIEMKIYYIGDSPYNEKLLFDNRIDFIPTSAGKVRRYFSLLNFFDVFKTGWGVLKTFFTIFNIFPDVVFGKGGYVSFPALFAARILRIPVIIHESDSVPGKVNLWAGKFAQRVALSYPQASKFFNAEKVAYTGNPIRHEIQHPLTTNAFEFLGLEKNIPTVLVLGGSQGSQLINDTIMEALPDLVQKFQIIHQTGKKNIREIRTTAEVVLRDSPHSTRYKPFDYLNDLALSMAAGAANVIVSRAGSTIFEIAAWGVPSIIIPITNSGGDHQRQNAFAYAREGACEVIEEANLSPHILISEIEHVVTKPELLKKMSAAAKSFSHLDAARKIADEIIKIALQHEK
jgi:UDP-N-acetylglucosamine--N-acetylmuramyl-(pentapeptide) pyrophosphoryl-undecaprenol N-acetylglucosamine transferase